MSLLVFMERMKGFKAIEKKREREAIFSEYVTDLKKSSTERDGQHKESTRSRTDKVCVVYVTARFTTADRIPSRSDKSPFLKT